MGRWILMGRELDCTQFCGMKGLYTTLTVFCVNTLPTRWSFN